MRSWRDRWRCSMAIYKAKQFYIDIEEQDYPDADCKYMINSDMTFVEAGA